MNPYRAPNEKQVGYLQEKSRETLEQVKELENIFASGDNKVDESDQLRGLYIIKFKRDIFMSENRVGNFSEEIQSNIILKMETKEDDTSEEIKDNTI